MLVVYLCLLQLAVYSASAGDLDIYSLHIRSDIQLRFATTLVTSRVANRGTVSHETEFSVTLPDEAFISNFTMEIDGVIYPGVVDKKATAKKKFDKAKKKGKSTGLVSNWPPESNTFRVQVNVAAQSKVTFNLTYQELLKRTVGVYQHKVFIQPNQTVVDLKVEVAIQESRDITRLHVPPLQDFSHLHTVSSDNNTLAVITRPTSRSAYITYTPSIDQQRAKSGIGLSGYFVVEYDIERDMDGGDVLVANGYFVHFLAPSTEERIPNDVLFILDMSQSMRGMKIDQLKDAMKKILGQLKEGDRFNILEFRGDTRVYKSGMVQVSPKSIREAIKYVERLNPVGWTNINQALLDGVNKFRQEGLSSGKSPIIVFLSDGVPTNGEENKQKILDNVLGANEGGVSIFSLAFGRFADWDLVKTIAIQNDGFGRKIYEDSDGALQISGFYDEIAVTLMNDVSVQYLKDTVDPESLTKSKFKNFFNGSEIVVAGKLEDTNVQTLDVAVLGKGAQGNLVLSVEGDEIMTGFDDVTGLMAVSDIGEITEKLWAYLTIKQMMENQVKTMDPTMRAKYKRRALELSLKYGFVTPLTSMVVTGPEDEDEETTTMRPTTTIRPQTTTRPPTTTTRPTTTTTTRPTTTTTTRPPPTTTRPPPTTTRPPPTTRRPLRYRGGGGGGGGYSGGGGGDPHFMIRIDGIEHPLCFDVRGSAGDIHNLITDPSKDITVNTLLVADKALDLNGNPKTFIGQVSVQLPHHVIIITPDAIIFDTKVFVWNEEIVKHFGDSRLQTLDHGRTVSIQLGLGSEIVIRRYVHRNPDKDHVDYLNVYVIDEQYFSKRTTGLLGQFVNGHKHIYMRKEFDNEGGDHLGKFQVKERLDSDSSSEATRHGIRAKLVSKSKIVNKGTEPCWMVHKKFEDLLLGDRQRYITNEFVNLQ